MKEKEDEKERWGAGLLRKIRGRGGIDLLEQPAGVSLAH